MASGSDGMLTERSHLLLLHSDTTGPATSNGVANDVDIDVHAPAAKLYSSPQPAQILTRGRSPSTVSSLDEGIAVDANSTRSIEPATTLIPERTLSPPRLAASDPSSSSTHVTVKDEPATVPPRAASSTKRRRVNPNNTSPTPSNAMSTPPSVVAQRKKIATKNRFLNLLQIDMKEPAPEKPKPRNHVAHEAKPAAKARTHTAPPRRRACATNPSPKSRRASTGAPRAKGKRKLSFAAPSSSSSEDDAEVLNLNSSDDDKDDDDTHHDDDEGSRLGRPAVYPWLVRQEKGKPPPEDWMWTMFDRDYFQPIDVSRADELERMSRAVATMGDPFIREAPPGWLPEATDEAPFVLPRRGRYYREVWQDQEFVEAVGGDFVALDDNHVLATSYNDDVFEAYYCKLEAALGDDGSFPIDGLLPDPTPAEATESDEIHVALQQCVAAFVPQVLSNWHTLRHLADRVRDMASLDALYEQEAALVQRVETSYNALRRRSKKAPGKRSLVQRAPSRTPAQTAACAFAAQFATQLVVGDGVDYLDATGQWASAVVVDVFPEAGERLTHVKVHMHKCSLASQTWVAVAGGRLLPPGAVSTREAPHLALQLANDQRGSAMRATAVLPCPSATVALARTLETLVPSSKP
ncbi:hypothetical protein, variant [Saprolegnia diclina VS20]|uniref:Uncharacterized protein n=1 Tax=Saprolegnia diclina (strain VS20) TaxID=1156394 RepID=T0QE23_SAPDV|nr:hypothetical protein, variant [Saprolegnia diclina VS20]EQC32961.1 hypothetical protein, variant [Saprolegnia diclina VS20]|eukprot:XP_008613647.1 hypothetical protein, variant [Saprolegnia diclina VS20]